MKSLVLISDEVLICNLLKFSFIWDLHNKKVCTIISNVLWNVKV